MALLLAVDPGVRGCGCALFSDGKLVRAAYVPSGSEDKRSDAWRAMAWAVERSFSPGVNEIAIECPTLYNGRSSRGDGRDLIELAAVVGAICLTFPEASVKVYHPAEWKGQIPKAVHHARAEGRLDEGEKRAIEKCRASLRHNVLDAVALGLTHLKRM